MNEAINNSAEVTEVKSDFCTLEAKVKKDDGKLPRIEYFRVDIDKGTGSAANWHATGYVLQVKVRGLDGMYLAGSVGAKYGMNVKSKYKTAEEAKEAGFKMKKTWGREKVAKTPKAKGPTKADLEAKVAELQAQLAEAAKAAESAKAAA